MATLHGLYSGSVLDNRDPENLARVLVRVSGLTRGSSDLWARLGTMMAGRDSGTLFIPAVATRSSLRSCEETSERRA